MLDALTVLVPMFVIFGVGFFAGYADRFRSGAAGINNFVFSIALPAFIYISIATAELPESFPWQTWLLAFMLPGSFALLVYFGTRWVATRHRQHAAPLALSSSYGNVGYFGIPITIALLGTEAAVPAAIVHLLHNLVFLIGYPMLRDQPVEGAVRESALRRFGREFMARAVLNPVTISTVVGIGVVALRIPVPELLNDTIQLLGSTAIPLALFSVGIAMHPALTSLRTGGLSWAMVLSGIGLKNLVFPLVTFGLAWLFKDALGPGWYGTIILMATMPMSTSGYILSDRYDESGDLAAAVLAGTTLLSIATIPLLVWLLL